jgi:type II secretory pathway component PulC
MLMIVNSVLEEFSKLMIVLERHKRVSLSVGLLLIVVMFYHLVTALIAVRDDFSILSAKPQVTQHLAMGDQTNHLIANIPNQHIFGIKALASTSNYIPITSLQLHLSGIMKVGNSQLSKAIISEAGKRGQIYGVGDKLPSGISINAVDQTGVVLENDGHLEKLPLARSTLSFQSKPDSLWNNG